MLERCPYYEKCSRTIRNVRGNREYYCLGSLNWEFCPQFKDYLLMGESIAGFGRDEEIRQIGRTIYHEIHNKLQLPLIIALISVQGEILHRDRRWTETYLLVTQNLVRYLIDSIQVGQFFKLENANNFLFMKIHSKVMLVCMIEAKPDELIESLQDKLDDYESKIDEYLSMHPITIEKEASYSPERNLVLELFTELQEKLQSTGAELIVRDLYRIQEKISDFFSWNKIFYEISILIEELEQVSASNELNNQERSEILEKIKEWQEKIRQTT